MPISCLPSPSAFRAHSATRKLALTTAVTNSKLYETGQLFREHFDARLLEVREVHDVQLPG